VRIDDVRRIDLGTFVRPAQETETILELDPRRIVFAHDAAVWVP
jgi:hypothetical protein